MENLTNLLTVSSNKASDALINRFVGFAREIEFPGILPLLLRGFFEQSIEIQQSSFQLLMLSWKTFPEQFIDRNIVSFMYTVVYTSVWILSRFSGVRSNFPCDEAVFYFASKNNVDEANNLAID
jgi:hypothetical protein